MDELKKWLEGQIRYWVGQRDEAQAALLRNIGIIDGFQATLAKLNESNAGAIAPAPEG